jgi:glycosyltransferase involved in cell wall biosynthesis
MTFDVVMLTSAHSATDDRIFYREAKTFAESGYSTCVVGKHPVSETLDGIHIQALRTARNRSERLWLGIDILKLALALNGKLFIIHDPELIGIALGLRLLGKEVIYDSHENLPMQIRQKDWIAKPLRRAMAPVAVAIEWFAGQALSGIIAAVPAIQRRFPSRKTVLVRNFPTRSALATLAEGPPLNERKNVVIYTGGLSRVRGIGELVDAFRTLDGAELWLVGEFDDPQFREEVVSSLPSNVLWLGWRSHPEVLKLYGKAKVGAVLLQSTPNHRCALPVKMFEYYGAGLPVIASDFPEYEELVRGCGVQVDPRNIAEIRKQIIALLENNSALLQMSTQARHRAVSEFSWEGEGVRLLEFCSRLITPSRSAAAAPLSEMPRHFRSS